MDKLLFSSLALMTKFIGILVSKSVMICKKNLKRMNRNKCVLDATNV